MAAQGNLAPGSTHPYVRFVVGADCENPHRLSGLFCHARALRDDGVLQSYEVEWLNEVFAWFNNHLPCPPFLANIKTGRWSLDAVSWFRSDAGEALGRMWDLVALLRETGMPVRFIRSSQPGAIVYSDQYQIVAESTRRMRR